MLALFSPPVLLFDKCAFVCTLIQYISRFATCQANFSCKLRAREKKKAFSCSNLFDNGWKLSFWCGDSHDWDGAQRNRSSLARWLGLSDDVATATTEMERQRNRSCGSRSYAWIFPFMWRQPRLRWSVSGIEVLWLAGWGFLMAWRQPRLRWNLFTLNAATYSF